MERKYVLIAAAALLLIIGLFFTYRALRTPELQDEVCDGIDNDADGLVDEGFHVTCSQDSDCGPSFEYGEPYCKEGDVWQGWYAQTCYAEEGTCMSKCLAEQTERKIKECPNECSRGACV